MATDSVPTIAAFDTVWASSVIGALPSAHDARSVGIPPVEIIWNALPKTPMTDGTDWVVFAGPVATRKFIESLVSDEFPLDLRVCAAGREIAEILRTAHIHSDLVPSRSSASEITEAMITFEGGELRARVTVIGGERRSAELAAAIRGAGGEALPGFGYGIKTSPVSGHAKFLALAAGGAIDIIAVRDSAEFEYLTELIPREDIQEAVILTDSGAVYLAAQEYGVKASLDRRQK